MRVTWPYIVAVEKDGHLIELQPGEPFDMPDAEAMARIAAGEVMAWVDPPAAADPKPRKKGGDD